MAYLNKVFLIGNLGNDPKIRDLPDGDIVASFSLATTHKYKSNGEAREQTDWHQVVVFKQLAAVARDYLKKGSSVHIEGRLRYRKWTDADGNARTATEIVVESLQMLGARQGNSQSSNSQGNSAPSSSPKAAQAQQPEPSSEQDFEDDIPF